MATKSLVFLTFIAGFLLEGIECGWGWSFRNDNGPKYWSKREEDCSPDGPSKLPQSPIDIPKASKRKYNVTMKDTVFTNYDKLLKGDIKNFGNIVRFQNITTASGESVSISKGLLYQKVYIATEFHFHFGENDNSESGHRFEGKKYPMELHIVHHKNPAKKLEGAVIVVFFIEKDKKNITNEKYLPVTRLLEHFNFLGSHEKRQHLGFSLREITNDSIRYAEDKGKHLHFFQYNGSLDEPPCYAVEWLVFKDPVKLSYAQVHSTFITLSIPELAVLVIYCSLSNAVELFAECIYYPTNIVDALYLKGTRILVRDNRGLRGVEKIRNIQRITVKSLY